VIQLSFLSNRAQEFEVFSVFLNEEFVGLVGGGGVGAGEFAFDFLDFLVIELVLLFAFGDGFGGGDFNALGVHENGVFEVFADNDVGVGVHRLGESH